MHAATHLQSLYGMLARCMVLALCLVFGLGHALSAPLQAGSCAATCPCDAGVGEGADGPCAGEAADAPCEHEPEAAADSAWSSTGAPLGDCPADCPNCDCSASLFALASAGQPPPLVLSYREVINRQGFERSVIGVRGDVFRPPRRAA